ncbi:MAG: asparagine synthase (glutamine-hydrolysing) [Methyloprofundus sp.]|nr:MAG: asparagine synthase (glutamine-hydrolysing) [Methyloprofundus sp.]
MTLLAGWVETLIKAKDAERLLQSHIAQAPAYTQKGVSIDSSEFYAVAANQQKKYLQQDVLLINAGNTELTMPVDKIIDNYLLKGEDFLELNPIEQALVIIEPRQKKLLLATDPIGLTQLYYAVTNKGLIFGNSADSIIAHPEVKTDISAQSIYDYVYYHHCPSPHTIYQNVNKLEGGQVLIYQDGKVQIKNYWVPEFKEKMSVSVAEAGKELQQRLVESVAQLADNEMTTGAFLSGGLDSSSVAGALAQVYPDKAQTFSMGFPVEGYDEIEYANIAVKHFNTQQHEYYLTPEDTVKAIPSIAAYYDEPFGNSSALAAYYCAKMAKDNGISVILGGDGGDEIFAGNERYAQQLVFEYYQQAPGSIQHALDGVLNHLPSLLAKQKLFFKAKRYVDQAKIPLPDRLQDYNFLHRHVGSEIFQDEFLQQIDSERPLDLLRECYHRPKQASTLNRMLYMDWKTTLHDNDLVKVNKMCEMAGVSVRYPLLSQSILDLSCQIPSTEKLQAKKLRKFYKQAMAGFLPEKIINKPKHGFGLPFGVWLKSYQPLKELAYSSIDSLKKRPYFKEEFLDHAIKMHQSVHAAYYGELIWILMMLELWFQGKDI